MAAIRTVLSVCVQLMLWVCWHDVCPPVHCLVGMLPTALQGLMHLLPHTVVLINAFVGLRHHLGGVSLCHCVAPFRLLLLLHSVGGLSVVQGGRLGHDHVGRALLQHAVKAAGQRHAHSLLGGAGVQVHLLLEESHALVLLLLLLQLLLGVLLRKLLGVLLGVLLGPLRVPALALGCDYLVPLVLTGGDCCHMLLLLLGGGQILVVGGVPLHHPPLLLVHLHSLLRLEAGHVHGALLSSYFVRHVVLLWVGVHASRGGRGVVLLGGVAGRRRHHSLGVCLVPTGDVAWAAGGRLSTARVGMLVGGRVACV